MARSRPGDRFSGRRGWKNGRVNRVEGRIFPKGPDFRRIIGAMTCGGPSDPDQRRDPRNHRNPQPGNGGT
jgi:hypothetical protein